jgi:prohibitin 2
MGVAIGINPGYLKLRKIRAAQNIARTVIRTLFLVGSKLIKNLWLSRLLHLKTVSILMLIR